MRIFSGTSVGTFVFVLLILLVGSAAAQDRWIQPTINPSLTFELLRPELGLDGHAAGNIDVLSSVWIASGRLPVRDQFTILFELPFAYYDGPANIIFPDDDTTTSETAVGAFLIGAEFDDFPRHEGLFGRVGLRLAPAAEGNFGVRYFAAQASRDRINQFGTETSVFGTLGHRWLTDYGDRKYRLEFAGGFGYVSGNGQAWARWYIQGWIMQNRWWFGGGLSARSRFYNDPDWFEDSVDGELILSVEHSFTLVRPGAQFRLPLDDAPYDFSLGMSMTFLMP